MMVRSGVIAAYDRFSAFVQGNHSSVPTEPVTSGDSLYSSVSSNPRCHFCRRLLRWIGLVIRLPSLTCSGADCNCCIPAIGRVSKPIRNNFPVSSRLAVINVLHSSFNRTLHNYFFFRILNCQTFISHVPKYSYCVVTSFESLLKDCYSFLIMNFNRR
jgi:hypothetical protein